ncbi:M17 family peptidase N-terminal domain-containing protein [Sphingomonas sp. NFR15]|uniref:M17 family peptidase N-terminal domain-containing protein n=1 Tax=Sphingomonas sp. NFR15 TaxID=1566282 RepID=UPI000887C692|nr:M17 family peptidase N-terminal domain-containing protein [Sphingomonas sp. NFR15]SDA11565.1 Cytosol aminopeptidase family, N-terminal domain [Sphingomonas sp. NFR15]
MTIDRRAIGSLKGVAVDVAGWDGVGAAVDLSCVCMFEREMPGTSIAGGLLHLDVALGGALSRLRTETVFRAKDMDFLVLDQLPAEIGSAAVLIIGLGDPLAWTPSVMERSVMLAAGIAHERRVASVAFAPSLLDSGIKATGDTPAAMLGGLNSALRRLERTATLELASRPPLRSWTFDAGIAHLDGAEAQFRAALTVIEPQA